MTGPFSRKISGFSCDLMALRKIKQLSANEVEMWLGVTGALIIVWGSYSVYNGLRCPNI